jgi:hypothetical protein
MNSPVMPVFSIAIAFVGIVSTLCLFLYYTGMRRSSAPLAWFVSLIIAVAIGVFRFRKYERAFSNDDELALSCFSLGVLIVVGTAFGIRLYRKWLDQALTEDERAGGIRGARAWLSPANLIVAGIITVSAWQGLGWSIVLGLVVTIGLLLLWPVLNTERAPIAPIAPTAQSSTLPPGCNEREKVLALLEAGKITAEESAELLHALASTTTNPSQTKPPTARPRGVVLAGAVLVLIGFFLPWFSFSPGEKLSAAMGNFGMGGGELERMTHDIMPHATVTVRGGDVSNGLGWLVLVLGVSSALLPLIAPQMDPSVHRVARLLAIGAGGIVVLYLVSQDVRSVNIGLVLVLAGYACQAVGFWHDERPAQATSPIAATDA